MKRLVRERPAFPFDVGEVCGWQGERVTVIGIPRSYKRLPPVLKNHVQVRDCDGEVFWTSITELTDPPPLPEHVQAAADEAVDAGMFVDPRRAVFGGEDS